MSPAYQPAGGLGGAEVAAAGSSSQASAAMT